MAHKYDVYLAGPFFNPAQVATMDAAKAILIKHGLKVCDPRELNGVIVDQPELRKEDKLRKIFNDNVFGVLSSFSVLACIDDRDTGTAWELGLAFGTYQKRGPLITFSGHEHGCNVMLAQSVNGHFPNLAALDEGIAYIAPELRSNVGHEPGSWNYMVGQAVSSVRTAEADQ